MSASSRWSPPYEENNQPTGALPPPLPQSMRPRASLTAPHQSVLGDHPLSQRLTRAARGAPSLTAPHSCSQGSAFSHSASLVQPGERGAQRPRWLARARQRPLASAPRPHRSLLTALAPDPRSHLCPSAPITITPFTPLTLLSA
jgi:hypothetical protein